MDNQTENRYIRIAVVLRWVVWLCVAGTIGFIVLALSDSNSSSEIAINLLFFVFFLSTVIFLLCPWVFLYMWFAKLKGCKYVMTTMLINIFVLIILVLIYEPWTNKIRLESSGVILKTRVLIQLHEEVIGYAYKHNGYLPFANRWCDLLIDNNKYLSSSDFQKFNKDYPCNIAFNVNLSDLQIRDIPASTVLLFIINGEWNLAGDLEYIREHGQENQYIYVCLIDGRIMKYRPTDGSIVVLKSGSSQREYFKSSNDNSLTIYWKLEEEK